MPKQQYSVLPIKKTGQQNEKLRYEDKFVSVTETTLIKSQHELVCKRLNNLMRVLVRHSLLWNKLVPTEAVILRNYIQYYYEYYQFDQFDYSFQTLPSLDVNLHSVSNQITIYKSYNIFHHTLWPIRFHNKFVAKMSIFAPNQIKYVLAFIMLLAEGHFYGRNSLRDGKNGQYGYVTPITTKSITHNRFFAMKIFRQKNILLNVGVEKIPIVKNGVIKRYQFQNYIQILDIISDQIGQNFQKLQDGVQRFLQNIKEDVAKRDHSDELVIQEKSKKKPKQHIDYMFQQYLNPYMGVNQIFTTEFSVEKKYEYKPLIFKPYYVSMGDTSSLIFNKELKRWVSSDYLTKLQQKALNQYQRKVNQQLIKRFVDFQSAKTLVDLLTKIPNFRVQLTQQQKDVIGENGNVLVIGRSGTGKTTCAVLRLFAIQMLFKIRLSLSKKKYQSSLKDTRCSADDIDKTMGLHCVFLTASPVLTNQIQRYYKKLTDNIKKELQNKKKRIQQKKKKQQQQSRSMKKQVTVLEQKADKIQELKPNQQQNQQYEQILEKGGSDDQQLQAPKNLQVKKSKQAIQQQQQMNKQLGGIQLEEKIQNEKFEQDEENYDQMKDQLEKKMKKFRSLADLRQEDYPGFFTVKSFIMMLDGTLAKPFFIRKSETNQQQSQATWHNEKKGVMMIQNYYRNEQQEKIEEVVEQQIQQQINYSDEEQLQHEYLRQIQLRENKQKQKLTDKLKKNKKTLSFEVDYDYFYTYFWPTVRHKHYSARNMTPHLVWTEIFSTIKGSANAHFYPGMNLTEAAYLKQSANAFLTKQQKLDVFQTYCQYERWKMNNGGYDMMDAVNYILNFIRFRGYSGPEIHYVMIDQVQDLPHAVIYLLSKTVRYGVFYSGDTAQTIAKGIGFRFCDLKNLFDPKQFDYSLQLNKPIVKQLTVNFRSHNNILQLANSVVSSIEILFPKTIDRLKKQVSNLQGPKPMILAQGDQQLLFYVLCGDQSYKKVADNAEGIKKPPLEFGCDQVIIVRDQQSKNKIPTMLQHALCLTIYEAKGLQFNDVILFNFFAESKCADKWNLLKYLKVIISQINAQQYEKTVTKHKKDKNKKEKQQNEKGEQKANQEPEQVDVECIVARHDNKVNVKKIASDMKLIMKDINDYAELCSELKMLYTAITRPKNSLIIYDEQSTARKPIQKLWQKLDVIELVSKQLLEQSNKKNKPQSQQLKIFKSIVNSTNQSQWKKQGMKMYSRGYFEQAMKCFLRSGSDQLYKKSLANNIADQATKKLIQIQAQRKAINNKLIQYQKMSDSDLSKLKKKLKRQQAQTFVKFQQAGKVFEGLFMFKQAGQCYFSGRKFQKAYENFVKAGMYKQAGESLQMLNKYREAAEYYQKQGIYLKVIQCLDMINEWQLILKKIKLFANQMTDLEKKSLFKKYSALALQQLVYQIQFENEPEENRPENNRVEVIKQQQNSQQEDWDSDEDPQIAAERALSRRSGDSSLNGVRKLSNLSGVDSQENIMRKISVAESQPKRKQSLIQEDKIIKQSVFENVQNPAQKQKQKQVNNSKADQSSFADLNQSSQHNIIVQQSKKIDPVIQSIYEKNQSQKKVQVKQESKNNVSVSENSFAQLNESASSFADLNSEHSDYNAKYPAELQPDIQSIRSMADPEDPWLQSALSQIPAKTHTQYSIIDEDQNYNPNVRIIKTKGNIVVQDQIMKKIVGIVSIVNQSVDEFFRQFKGYQSLITVSKTGQNDTIDNRPQISQFEDIDPKFINIILDTLESFKLYKLCLFVCNRYHMPHKAGRYLISMALRYSTNSQINNFLNPALIAPSLSRKSQLQKGILASIALHAMFENVSPDFLKIKVNQYGKQQSKNTLGSYFIQGLILQGLYKKAVFMVNPQQSLRILKNFCDTTVYQQVFKQKFLKKSQDQPAQFLSIAPKTELQQQFTLIKLQQALKYHNILQRIDTVSQRYYKQFNIVQLKSSFENIKLQPYTPLLYSFMNDDKSKITIILSQQAKKLLGNLDNGSNYIIYDTVAFLTTVIRNQHYYPHIFELRHTQFLQILACIRSIRKTLYKKHKPKTYQILQAVLSIFMCRMIDPCRSTQFINDGYSFVHRTSTICNEFVQQIKKNKNQIAYFFEQDYNYILVKTSKLIQIICKRFDQAYGKFIRSRIEAKPSWVGQISHQYLVQDFQQQQSEYLLKALLRQQIKLMYPKQKKTKKQTSIVAKKILKPKFNYKTQGRPELVIDLESSSQQQSIEQKKNKMQITNFFIFPDVNSEFKYFSDLSIAAFYQRLDQNNGKMISGRLLYCAGLNDSYKQFINKRGGYNLYDAIQFRKFHRLDLYADNLLTVINELSYTQRHMLSAQIIIHMLVQYKILVNGKNFKLQVPRRFLKFFPNLKLIQAVGIKQQPDQSKINSYLRNKQNICIFSYENLYSSQLQQKQIVDIICEFLQVLKAEQTHKCYNIQKLILILIINMPNNQQVYECLRDFIQVAGYDWPNPILNKLKGSGDYQDFIARRQKVLSEKQLLINSYFLNEIRVIDKSNIQKDITQSQNDYEIKQKILQARTKAVNRIATWWRIVKKKNKPSDQLQIIKQNRVIKFTHTIKYIPYDDRFLLRSSLIRDLLLSFYLKNIVTSSLDFHFILMKLNNIEEIRNKYIQAYKKQTHGIIQIQQKQTDFEQEIANIESVVEIWKNDQKWLKDRNIDLKRKKVFQVKWMTKNSIHKIIKKRAGLHKQKKLQDKKKFLKKNQL